MSDALWEDDDYKFDLEYDATWSYKKEAELYIAASQITDKESLDIWTTKLNRFVKYLQKRLENLNTRTSSKFKSEI
jgi:hypothetical protein